MRISKNKRKSIKKVSNSYKSVNSRRKTRKNIRKKGGSSFVHHVGNGISCEQINHNDNDMDTESGRLKSPGVQKHLCLYVNSSTKLINFNYSLLPNYNFNDILTSQYITEDISKNITTLKLNNNPNLINNTNIEIFHKILQKFNNLETLELADSIGNLKLDNITKDINLNIKNINLNNNRKLINNKNISMFERFFNKFENLKILELEGIIDNLTLVNCFKFFNILQQKKKSYIKLY